MIVCVLFALPLYLTELTGEVAYQTDEFIVNDAAEAFYHNGTVVSRTSLQGFLIYPGTGWTFAIHGFFLHFIDFHIFVSRSWVFILYLLAALGVGAVAGKLYGKPAGFIAFIFAYFAKAYIITPEWRADHQLPAVIAWIIFFYLILRDVQRPKLALFLHFIMGLIVTQTVQVHAMGIIIACSFSFIYLVEYVYKAKQTRQLNCFISDDFLWDRRIIGRSSALLHECPTDWWLSSIN